MPEIDESLVITNSIELFKMAPNVLVANRHKTIQANAVGNKLLAKWEETWAIEDDDTRLAAINAMDERSNGYLVNVAAAVKKENEDRSPHTQMMTEISKMFISCEGQLDKTKPGTIPFKMQQERNKAATERARIQKIKDAEIARKKAMEMEAIEIKDGAERFINSTLFGLLTKKKEAMSAFFNSITLETFDVKSGKINAAVTTMSGADLKAKVMEVTDAAIWNKPIFHSTAEAAEMMYNVIDSFDYDNWAIQNWNVQVGDLKQDLIDKLPSKKKELTEAKRLADEAAALAEKNRIAEEKRQAAISAQQDEAKKAKMIAEAEAKRLADEKALQDAENEKKLAEERRAAREKADAYKLAEDTAKMQQQANDEADIKKQGEETMANFNADLAASELTSTAVAKTEWKITAITHMVGWGQIFQFWYKFSGQALDPKAEDIGNWSLERMKKFVEKEANSKTPNKLVDKNIVWQEVTKALNKKA